MELSSRAKQIWALATKQDARTWQTAARGPHKHRGCKPVSAASQLRHTHIVQSGIPKRAVSILRQACERQRLQIDKAAPAL